MDAYTYILRCQGNNLYVGSTKNIQRRFQQHKAGFGANFTKKYPPIEIAYLEIHQRIDHAFNREKQIQRWSRSKKESLIQSDTNELRELAACRNDSHFRFKKNEKE